MCYFHKIQDHKLTQIQTKPEKYKWKIKWKKKTEKTEKTSTHDHGQFQYQTNIIQLRNLSLVSTFDISENYYTKNCIQPRISPWKFIKINKK